MLHCCAALLALLSGLDKTVLGLNHAGKPLVRTLETQRASVGVTSFLVTPAEKIRGAVRPYKMNSHHKWGVINIALSLAAQVHSICLDYESSKVEPVAIKCAIDFKEATKTVLCV